MRLPTHEPSGAHTRAGLLHSAARWRRMVKADVAYNARNPRSGRGRHIGRATRTVPLPTQPAAAATACPASPAVCSAGCAAAPVQSRETTQPSKGRRYLTLVRQPRLRTGAYSRSPRMWRRASLRLGPQGRDSRSHPPLSRRSGRSVFHCPSLYPRRPVYSFDDGAEAAHLRLSFVAAPSGRPQG